MIDAYIIEESVDALIKLSDMPWLLGIVLAVAVIIVFIWKALPVLLTAKMGYSKFADSIETNRNNIAAVADSLNSVCETLREVKDNTDKMRLEVGNVHKDTLKAVVFNDDMPILDRMFAFNRYIKMGGNGTATEKMKSVIYNNFSIWESVLEMNKSDPVADERYWEKLKELEKEW